MQVSRPRLRSRRRTNNFSLIFDIVFFFFFSIFSEKLRGRVTRNIEKKAHGLIDNKWRRWHQSDPMISFTDFSTHAVFIKLHSQTSAACAQRACKNCAWWTDINKRDVWRNSSSLFVTKNRPFAQLQPGLETGHPVTVGQSPAHESHSWSEQSEKKTRKTAFCSS